MPRERAQGKRDALIEALKAGCTIAECGRRSGFGRTYIYELARTDPDIGAAMERKRAMTRVSESEIEEMQKEAFATLRQIAQSGEKDGDRINAAKVLLNFTLGRGAATKPTAGAPDKQPDEKPTKTQALRDRLKSA